MRFRQYGFAHLGLVLIVVVIAGIGAVGWYVWQKQAKEATKQPSTAQPSAATPEEKADTSLLPFSREASVFTNDNLNNVEVVKLNDGRYRMYYHERNQTKSAISSDGKTFTLESGTRVAGDMPATIKLGDGKFRMYFKDSGGNIKSAVSSDGLSFTVEAGTRLSKGPAGSLDSGSLIHPSVVTLPDGSFRMYYDGVNTTSINQGPDNWSIMSAKSKDGLAWEKDSGVRIDAHNP